MERNDIIKALEVCVKGNACTLCPLVDDMSCARIINENALALITSQDQMINAQRKTAKKLRRRIRKANSGVKIYENRVKQLTEENERLKTRYVSMDNLIIAETARKIFGKLESNLRITFINGDEENAMLIIGYDDYDAIKKEMGVNQDE